MKPEPEDNLFQKIREKIAGEKPPERTSGGEGRVITSVQGIAPQNRSAVKRGAKGNFEAKAGEDFKESAPAVPTPVKPAKAKRAAEPPVKPAEPTSAPKEEKPKAKKAAKPKKEKKKTSEKAAATPAPAAVVVPPPEKEAASKEAEHAPMRPPKPGEASVFVPVPYVRKEGDPPIPVSRRSRKVKPRYLRMARINLWFTRRRIIRQHAKYRLRQVAGFYLGVLGAVALVGGGYLLLNSPGPRIAEAVPLPPDKLTKKLLADTGYLMNLKKYDRAWKNIERLQQLEPGNPNVYLLAGAVHATKKDYPKAREAFNKAQQMSPTAFAPAFNLAEMEFTAGNYAEADRLFRQLRTKFSPNRLVLFRLYLCAVKLGQPDIAAPFLNSPDIDPQSPEWFYIHGVDALQNDRKREGRRTLEAARSLFGKTAEPYDQTLDRIGLSK